MSRHMKYLPHGVIPAVLLPFHEDLSIDAPSFRSHLRDVASVEGVSAITVNAHATEVASCSFDEQKTVLELTQNEIGARLPIVNGVYADGSIEAARIAKMAHEGGASALLVFPPGIFNFGQRAEMAVEHFRRIAEATDLPLILFQYPPAGGQGYPLATLLKIIDAVPSVRAIKDWSANPQLHERQIRALQSRTPPVTVLSTHSAWLLSSLVLGCNGLLSGSGSVIADLQVRPLPRGAGQRSRHGAPAQRPHLAHRGGVLPRALGGHAQPHEGSAGAARQTAARRGSPAAGEAPGGGNRAHPAGADRRRAAGGGRAGQKGRLSRRDRAAPPWTELPVH